MKTNGKAKAWSEVLLDTAADLERRGKAAQAEWYLLNALREEKQCKVQSVPLMQRQLVRSFGRDWRN